MLKAKKRYEVRTAGDRVLGGTSAPVGVVTPEICELAESMIRCMDAFDGIGLAAPQYGVSQRLIVIDVPLSDEEIEMLGNREQEVVVNFEEGESVVVVSGAWKDTVGVVQRMDMGKQTATIMVELFGRETPVEISFDEINKANY